MEYIPKGEWWCGCIPNIKFKTQKQFVNHLFREHASSYDTILNDIRVRKHSNRSVDET